MKRIDRRTFLAAAGAAAGIMAGTAGAKDSKPPNIVFILADDLGRHQIGCYGNPFYETPNIDRLAGQGVRFTDAYAACPVCSPTRASIMTGKYPARLHITDYIPGNPYPYAKLKTPDWTKQLPLDEVTVAERLQTAGYTCGHFGKWHLSYEKLPPPGTPGRPESQGFDEVLITEKPKAGEAARATAERDYDAHHAREITDRAIAFMEQNKERPFFCYVSHNLVHKPEMEYGPDIIKYAAKPEASNQMGNNPVLGAMVESLDRQVGRLVEALDSLKLSDDTLVIFFSDNGDFYGREGLKPFYGSKADLYEGGIRVPLIVRWPGKVETGSTCAEPVCSIDFHPTLAEVAGASVADAAFDGISFLPALANREPLARDALYWHYPHYHSAGIGPSGAIRQGQYKLIEWFEKSIDGPETEGAVELFDLSADPGERHNLTSEMPEKARSMYENLRAWRKDVGAQEMKLNPDHDPGRADSPA